MFAGRSENRSMPEVPHTRRPVFRAQFWSAGEVADVSQKNVGVDELGSLIISIICENDWSCNTN